MRKSKSNSSNNAGPSAEALRAVALKIEEAAYSFLAIKQLASEAMCAYNESELRAFIDMSELNVRRLDFCLGILDGTGRPTLGNFSNESKMQEILEAESQSESEKGVPNG
jgi:hypothetical protein